MGGINIDPAKIIPTLVDRATFPLFRVPGIMAGRFAGSEFCAT